MVQRGAWCSCSWSAAGYYIRYHDLFLDQLRNQLHRGHYIGDSVQCGVAGTYLPPARAGFCSHHRHDLDAFLPTLADAP